MASTVMLSYYIDGRLYNDMGPKNMTVRRFKEYIGLPDCCVIYKDKVLNDQDKFEHPEESEDSESSECSEDCEEDTSFNLCLMESIEGVDYHSKHGCKMCGRK